MVNKAHFWIFLLVLSMHNLAYAACQSEGHFPYTDTYGIEECPEDIQSWMNKVDSCAHLEKQFETSDLTDKERLEAIEWEMLQLECCKVACDYYHLSQKYKEDEVHTGVIIGYTEAVYGDGTKMHCLKKDEAKTPQETP